MDLSLIPAMVFESDLYFPNQGRMVKVFNFQECFLTRSLSAKLRKDGGSVGKSLKLSASLNE